MSSTMLTEWMQSQRPKAPAMRGAPTFYRNLEEALDVRRKDHGLFITKTNIWKIGDAVDFSSNDTLSLGASGRLRAQYNEELERHPHIPLGSGSSRIMDGNYEYLELVENEIAQFHGAETGLMIGSGFEANLAIFAAIPRPGDAVLYDELVHASTHDGMQQMHGVIKMPFRHNDVDAFREGLLSLSESQPLVRQGRRCVIVAVESFYSMDGDICPLKDLVEAAKEIFPEGQVQFLVDEAHSTGVVGPNGAGLVSELGLVKEVAIRLHTFGKALASSGGMLHARRVDLLTHVSDCVAAIILGNSTLRAALLNLARPVIYTTAPSFPLVAAGRSAYVLMKTGQTRAAQASVQSLVRFFFQTIASNVVWQKATKRGILDVPLATDWEDEPFLSHIIPIRTRHKHSYWLVFHMNLRKICAFPVEYPTVPEGQSRVRLAFHANNTQSQVEQLVDAICEWAEEMIKIEEDGGGRIPRAARQVYAGLD
ncbi:MAG: hypothetical protein Q9217_000117 [Psora testacea]